MFILITHYSKYIHLGELLLAFISSRRAHVRMIKVDPGAALAVSGVHSVIDHIDVQGRYLSGIPEEELFVSGTLLIEHFPS